MLVNIVAIFIFSGDLAVNYKIKKVGKGGVLFNTTHTSHNIRIIMVLITPQVGHE